MTLPALACPAEASGRAGGRDRPRGTAAAAAGRRGHDGGGPQPRRRPATHRGDRRRARRRQVRRARRALAGPGPSAAHLRPPRHARGAGRGDRSPAAGARRAGAADRPPRAAAPARHQRAPGGVRLPRPAPAHVVLPRRAGAYPGQGVRQPLPHREGRRGRLHRRGRGDRGRPRRRGGRRDRERPAVRRGLAAAALARGDRGDHGPADRGRTRESTSCRRSRTGRARWRAPTWPGS